MDGTTVAQPDHLLLRLDDPLILPLIPRAPRDGVLLLWELDARLSQMARSGREPALRQIRLRWWSERLAALGDGTTPAEPLLARVQAGLLGPITASELAMLSEAWEPEAVDEPDDSERGALLYELTSRLLHAPGNAEAGRLWAAVERAIATGEGDWERLRERASPNAGLPLPRALAALTAMSRRIAKNSGRRSRWREQAAILRAGLWRR